MQDGFQTVLNHIRFTADFETHKGRLFERLMKSYFQKDPLYRERFSGVRLLSEWAARRAEFDGADIGIDLVAEERDGGHCAIQCECYAPGTRISKPHIDSFISASAREPFAHRLMVDTGDEWGPAALKTITRLKPECQVLRFGDLANRPFDWPDLVEGEPEDLAYRHEPYSLRPHQQTAFDEVTDQFADHDRGKLIMACGTGKTFTALRVAEAVAGIGGRVLYFVPSISLFQQSMREWAEQQAIPHRYFGICSDTRAGRNDEDASIQELEIPVSTDPATISKALRITRSDAMTVVFSTYHSLAIVERAQDNGAPPFDIVLCDEAHKTTGIERPGDKTSPFVLVHDDKRIRALKRLYVTATPRPYTQGAKAKAADRLGIVYTPVKVVDFILGSANHALQQEFGRSLSDEGVHVLDPFTGTGIFLVRLIQSALVDATDLARKYRKELHANEIVLLAYYIAAVHIEEAFHGRRGAGAGYEPFSGVVLTDTFNPHTERTAGFPREWLPDNGERVERQQNTPIQVIVGSPPWSAGQRSSADDSPNVDYPEIKKRVTDTYAARSTGTNKNSLYDTYKMAIRWASDRIGDKGVVALATNGSWIDGNVDSGVRPCLAEEFSTIYEMNMRGNQRTQGERSRREGGKIFGRGSRAPVAITILVRNPDAEHEGCRILYRDIGDYLKREEKLAILTDAGSIAGIDDWREIKPDKRHDWIGQRDPTFQAMYPMGSKTAKADKADDASFKLFGNGYKTGRDAYIYNFSHEACATNARRMVDDYSEALSVRGERAKYDIDQTAKRYSAHVKWDRELKNNLRRGKDIEFSERKVRKTQYRPFVKQHCYADHRFAQMKYQQDSIFPALFREIGPILAERGGTFRTDRRTALPDGGDARGFGECAMPSRLFDWRRLRWRGRLR